jgi:hypothetical protein
MASPFDDFLAEARRLTSLVQGEGPIEDARVGEFVANRKRLDFLEDLIGHVAVLAFSYEGLCRLTDKLWGWDALVEALPTEPGRGNMKIIPPELSEKEEALLVEADALTSLVYYEVTTVVSMLRQVEVAIDPASEIQYMTKVRDRFLAHVRLAGVARGAARGHAQPKRGFLRRDVVSLSGWSREDLRALGDRALRVGSPQWEAQRSRNEELVLSRKKNERFTPDEKIGLMAAGVRECEPERALEQLAAVAERELLPIIGAETQRAIEDFGWERWVPEGPLRRMSLL